MPESMPYVLIIHDVEDFDAWTQVFDAAAEIRKQAGEISYQVLRDATRPNQIVHFSRWASHQKAKAFFESPRLVELRKEAGVRDPEFIYLIQELVGTL